MAVSTGTKTPLLPTTYSWTSGLVDNTPVQSKERFYDVAEDKNDVFVENCFDLLISLVDVGLDNIQNHSRLFFKAMGNAGDCFLGFFLKVKYSIYIIFTFFWQLFDVICQGVSKWQPCSQALQENIKNNISEFCIYLPPSPTVALPTCDCCMCPCANLCSYTCMYRHWNPGEEG